MERLDCLVIGEAERIEKAAGGGGQVFGRLAVGQRALLAFVLSDRAASAIA